MEIDTGTGKSIRGNKIGIVQTNHPYIVQPRSRVESISWRVTVRSWIDITTKRSWQKVETCSLRFSSDDPHRTPLCSNRKRGISRHMGMRKIFRLHPGQENRYRDRSQTPHPNTRNKTPRQFTSKNTPISVETYPVRLHNLPCLYTADALSRAPVGCPEHNLEKEADLMAQTSVGNLPVSEYNLASYRLAQNDDADCSAVIQLCKNGWTWKSEMTPALKPYWEAQGHLTVQGDLLLYDERIVIPKKLRDETIEKIHKGHQGMQRCSPKSSLVAWNNTRY